MSIETEISRIQTATGDIKTAIAGKGVTVPGGSQIDDLPALISSIPTGGGTIVKNEVTLSRKSANTYNISNYVTNEPFFFVFSAPIGYNTGCTYFMYGINGTAMGGYIGNRWDAKTAIGKNSEAGSLFNYGATLYYCTYSNGIITMTGSNSSDVSTTGRLVYYTVQ